VSETFIEVPVRFPFAVRCNAKGEMAVFPSGHSGSAGFCAEASGVLSNAAKSVISRKTFRIVDAVQER
jgi:hypothetical protein